MDVTGIAERFAALASELDAVERRGDASATEYSRNGRVFAATDATTASFLLLPDVAAAAARTPGTAASSRGPHWVTLELATSDRFTIDRAEAWFVSAWRAAGAPRPS